MRRTPFVTLSLLLTSLSGCAGMNSVYTARDLDSELDQLLSQLPPVELLASVQSKGVTTLVLRGQGALFNPAPPPDDAWLRGKISARDYTHAIDGIDLAVTGSLIGMPRMYAPTDVARRLALKEHAAQAEIAALNARWHARGITFSWHQEEDARHWKDAFLYVRVE